MREMYDANLHNSNKRFESDAFAQDEQSDIWRNFSDESQKRLIVESVTRSTLRHYDNKIDRHRHYVYVDDKVPENLRSTFETSRHNEVGVNGDGRKQYDYIAYESEVKCRDYCNTRDTHSNTHNTRTDDDYFKGNLHGCSPGGGHIQGTSGTQTPTSSKHERDNKEKPKITTSYNSTHSGDKIHIRNSARLPKETNGYDNLDTDTRYTDIKTYREKTQGGNAKVYQDQISLDCDSGEKPRRKEHYYKREQFTENNTKTSLNVNSFDYGLERQLRNSPDSDKSNGHIRNVNTDVRHKIHDNLTTDNQNQHKPTANDISMQRLEKEKRNALPPTMSKTSSRKENTQQQKYDHGIGDRKAGITKNGHPDVQRMNNGTGSYREKPVEYGQQRKRLPDRPVSDTYISGKEKHIVKENPKHVNERVRLEQVEMERRSNESKQTKYSNHFENCNDDLSSSRVVEKFKFLYDMKWTILCKWMCQTCRSTPEIKIVQYLSHLMKSCYKECLHMSDNQIRQFLLLRETDVIPKHEEHPELFALRKQYARRDDIRKKVREIVKDKVHIKESLSIFDQEINREELLGKVETFVDEFTDSCWMITVSEPAISLNFDVVGKMYSDMADHFSVFSLKKPVDDPTKTEGTVYEVVWPSVQLKFSSEIYKKGDVIVIKKNTKTISTQT